MFDHRTEDRHATLIAGLILVILLAAVVVLSAPVATQSRGACGFAAAVPETTVFFVDISDPVEQIDLMADMGLLADVAEVMAVAGEGSGFNFLVRLGAILESWHADPGLRADIESVAGRRATFVLLSSDLTRWPIPLVALKGAGDADPVSALGSLFTSLGLGTVVTSRSSSANQDFTIEDDTDCTVFDGCVAGDWLVLGPKGTGAIAAELAGCLAGWGPCPERPLAALPTFERTAAMLPGNAATRGFLNVSQLGVLLAGGGYSVPPSLLGWTDGIAFARQITRESTETWAAGRFVPNTKDDAQSRLLALLAPIGKPLSAHLPHNALATYDLGAPAAETVDVLSQLLETSAPHVHTALQTALDDFRMASGLHPELDLLPYLDRGIAVGVLPPEGDPEGWPLPRPVLLARSTDDAAVRRFFDSWLRWEAGALAPMTQGLLSAVVDSQRVAGAELTGLQLDSVLAAPLPLPSPTVAVVDGLVIASPVRSAVVDILSRHQPEGTSATVVVGDAVVVELMWLNLPAWPEAWRRTENLLTSPALEHVLEPGPVIDVARSLMRLLGGFGPAHGVTTMTPDGDFVFHVAAARDRDPMKGAG